MTGPDRLTIERKAREMYRAENARNVQRFHELPGYAQDLYRRAARVELERAAVESAKRT